MNRFLRAASENDPANAYLGYHARRYNALIGLIGRYHRQGGRILDVGRSPFSLIVHKEFGVPVDTMGFEADGPTDTGFNFNFDLNYTDPAKLPPGTPQLSGIVRSRWANPPPGVTNYAGN